MSDISFSHQFSKQWRDAPPNVKNAIAQELNDIVHLLEEDTNLETFSFTYPDLNEHLEQCYTQAFYERAYAPETNITQHEDNNLPDITHQYTEALQDDSGSTITHQTHDSNTDDTNETIELTAQQAQIVKELETHIEDYLSEQMTTLSDNLRAWLVAEVKNRITTPNP